MLARTEEPDRTPAPKPVEPKRRTVTLTNRAPISIIENDWPEVAQGCCGEEFDEAPVSWNITIRVRRDRFDRCIIHASYKYCNDIRDEGQTVRVGRMLDASEGVVNLWKHIIAIGDELRERIVSEKHRKAVTYAVDACFANLPPHQV